MNSLRKEPSQDERATFTTIGYYFFHHLGLDRNVREKFRDHPWFARTAEFCSRYDGPAFDPNGETLPLHYFEPMVRRVLAAPRESLYVAPKDAAR